MTTVNFAAETDALGGAAPPDNVTVTALAERAEEPAVRVDGETVTLPALLRLRLQGDGPWALELPALAADCYWRIRIYRDGDLLLMRTVAPPVLDVVAFGALVDVDPTTTVPVPGSDLAAAYLAQLDEVRAAVLAAGDPPPGALAVAGAPFVTGGNSMHTIDWNLARPGRNYTERLRDLTGMISLTLKAVFGTTAGRIARNALNDASATGASTPVPTALVPRSKAFTGFTVMGNNLRLGASPENVKAVREAARTIAATITAEAKFAAASAPFVYSAGWTLFEPAAIAGPWPVGQPGAYLEHRYAGEQGADYLFSARADLPGLIRFTEGADVLGTLDTSGVTSAEASVPMTFRVRGRGAGQHTIRATVLEGFGLFDGALIPSTAPTSGYVLAEMVPDVSRYNPSPGLDWEATRDALWDAVLEALADYPTILPIKPPLAGWDAVAMTGDGLHPNEAGADYILRWVLRALSHVAYSVGLGNQVRTDQQYPAPYVAPPRPPVPAGGDVFA